MNYDIFWLLRRFVNDKSKSTFYMVLLILGVVGNLISLFKNSRLSIVNLILAVVILYFVLGARKK